MKPRLPRHLLSALLVAVSSLVATMTVSSPAGAADTSQTLHVYILTGQSNSQGAVYNNPASAEQLAAYRSDAIMWNGNFTSYNPVKQVSTSDWTHVEPQQPVYTNLCMGPEYGFSYMMEKFADAGIIGDVGQLAVIKDCLSGGGNQYWVKGSATYQAIYGTTVAALEKAIENGYTGITIDGLMYLQGESNSGGSTNAGTMYVTFKDTLSADLSNWLASQSESVRSAVTINFADNTVMGQPSQSPGDTDARQRETAGTNTDGNNIGYLYTSDLGGSMRASSSTIHFGGSAQLVIGARYAYAFAVQNGSDVGAVRSSDKSRYLDDKLAWWMEKLPATTEVVKWDLSSVSVSGGNRIQNSLEVGGIKVEDPYNTNSASPDTVYITGGTLSVGSHGIELEQGGLSIASAFATTADQEWKVAAGNTLEIGTSAASSSLGGGHTVSIGEQAAGRGAGTVRLYASADGGHDFELSDGATLEVSAGNTVWRQTDVTVKDSGTFGTIGNGAVSIGTLSLADGAVFDFGGSTGVQLAVDSLSLGGAATFKMNVNSASVKDLLTIGSVSGGESACSITFDLAQGSGVLSGVDYVLVDGWDSGLMTAVVSATSPGAPTLKVSGRQLLVTFVQGASEDFTKPWVEPSRTDLTVDASPYDATAKAQIEGGIASTVVTGASVTGANVFASRSNYTGDVYAEIRDASVNWVAAYGGTGSGDFHTITGSASVKVGQTADTTARTVSAVYGTVNGSVSGDSYVELEAGNYTYGTVNGAHNARVGGNSTIVVRRGTVTGNLIAGIVSNVSGDVIHGDVRLQIDGGTFKGMVAGGSSGGTNGVIEGDINVNINGGKFENYVIGCGFAGTYQGDVHLTISSGDFSSMNSTKGIYAGVGSASSRLTGTNQRTTVSLSSIDSSNDFARYTGVLSGGNQANNTSAAWETKTLELKAYTASELKANLESFTDVVVKQSSNTTIKKSSGASDLGGAARLGIDGTSTLVMEADTAAWDASAVAVTIEEGGVLQKAGSYNLSLGSITGSGTLKVAGGAASVGTFTGITADVAGGSTLTVNLPVADASLGTLKGSGTVLLGANQLSGTGAAMKFAMGEDWTGTVKLTADNIKETGNVVLNLNNFGRAGSTIEIDGVGNGKSSVSGDYFYQPNGAVVDANLRLTGNFTLTAGGSGQTYTFNGTWSGSGNFENSYTGFNVGSPYVLQLNGNMKDYSGTITLHKGQKLNLGNGDITMATFDGGSASGTGVITGGGEGGIRSDVTVNYLNDVTLDSSFQGGLNLVLDTMQTAALTKANSYTGSTTVKSGSLVLRDGGTLGSGQVTIKNNPDKSILSLAIGDKATLSANGQDATITNHAKVDAESIKGASGSSLAEVSHADIKVKDGQSLAVENVLFNNTVFSGCGSVSVDGKIVGKATWENTGTEEGILRLSGEAGTRVSDAAFDISAGTRLEMKGITLSAGSSISDAAATLVASGLNVEARVRTNLTSQGVGQLAHDIRMLGDGAPVARQGESVGRFTLDNITDVTIEGDALVITLMGDYAADLENCTWVEVSLTGGAVFDTELPVSLQYSDAEGNHTLVGYYSAENGTAAQAVRSTVYFNLSGSVPEPATGTLSLLALAGLCARRRRK